MGDLTATSSGVINPSTGPTLKMTDASSERFASILDHKMTILITRACTGGNPGVGGGVTQGT